MSDDAVNNGYVPSGKARLYYETAGAGQPLVMLHAGVADRRMWNHEFRAFAGRWRVLRYDLRGYGNSQPVDEAFTHLGDLVNLLDALDVSQPAVLMGCSMGGQTAMDFALAHPQRARALIMVGSAPGGLDLDVPTLPDFAAVEQAFKAGDLHLAAELETHIWFDGVTRTPEQVNADMRRLVFEMNLLALEHEARGLGKRQANLAVPAATQLAQLHLPVLIVAGEHDNAYIRAAADYMESHLRVARKVMMPDAAHLPNMDHPAQFEQIVSAFLDELTG